jgi:Xaa-Pro aminopeptidase
LLIMFEARFQSFEDRNERGASAPHLAALRAELKRRGLDGFIVPRADRYQNEYVPPRAERLAWLTGFTGSAGVAIVLAERAVIFVDGRYLVQVREEVDSAAFTVEHLVEHPLAAWIEENLPAGAKLGYSPWLHTVDGAERL